MKNSTIQQNKRTLLYVLGLVCFMVGLGFASVPLYDAFCRITGFGGTPGVADGQNLAASTTGRNFKLSFNADIAPNLNWEFSENQRSMPVIAGKSFLAFYSAKNTSDIPQTGVATFNVLPLKAAKYFKKINCFCFDNQTLQAGETQEFPVSYYIDPEIENDKYMKDVKEITLSYTFFKAKQ